MKTTAIERLEELRDRTGCREGVLHGEVEVSQIYAHYQHEHLEFRHPRGGRAMFLGAPLLENHWQYLADIAATFLEDGGQEAMKRSMEDLAEGGGVDGNAPVELGDLRASGHPKVALGHRTIYDRPPRQHRLDEEELKAKSRAVQAMRIMLGLPVFYKLHGKIMVIPGRGSINVIGKRP